MDVGLVSFAGAAGADRLSLERDRSATPSGIDGDATGCIGSIEYPRASAASAIPGFSFPIAPDQRGLSGTRAPCIRHYYSPSTGAADGSERGIARCSNLSIP